MENKAVYVGRTIYPCGRSVGKSTDLAMTPTAVTVTEATWEEMRRCSNCGHEKRTHMDDGACLFEPTQFQAPPPPDFAAGFDQIETWSSSYTSEVSMNHGPAPKIPKYKAETRKTFRSPRPPKARR